MNAHGISVFYGSNYPRVALAEVRPPVGCQVAVARFQILRPIRLLDLNALKDAATSGSIFEQAFKDLERTAFLRTLSDLITTPVMPDNEAAEYLATQAVSDFLATENNPPLDGLIFPTVQSIGESFNVVIFHKSARIEEMDLPNGTKCDAQVYNRNEEGLKRKYMVEERVLPSDGQSDFFATNLKADSRPTTLRVDLKSVHVHVVHGVRFATSFYPVERLRLDTTDPDF
jgi:hypothetical protein